MIPFIVLSLYTIRVKGQEVDNSPLLQRRLATISYDMISDTGSKQFSTFAVQKSYTAPTLVVDFNFR